MEGIVLHYDPTNQNGIIRDEGGNRYSFAVAEWASAGTPIIGARVDFMAHDGEARQIFAAPGSISPAPVAPAPGTTSTSSGQASAGDFANRIQNLFTNGLHNGFGLAAAIVAIVSLFMPVLAAPFGLGSANLIDLGSGKLALILLIVVAILFYGGATRLFTQIAVALVFAVLLYQYQEIYSKLSQANSMAGMFGRTADTPNFFGLLRLGALINIVACIALGYAAFSRAYRHNSKAI